MAVENQAEEARSSAIIALHGGNCVLCPRRVFPGDTIVRQDFGAGRSWAHLDCVAAGRRPEGPVPVEDQLEEARHALVEVARLSRPEGIEEDDFDFDQVIYDVYERAVGTLLSLNEQRTRGRG